MYRVVQIHRTRYGDFKRYWDYKTESGARRRVLLCTQSADNISAYYFKYSCGVFVK